MNEFSEKLRTETASREHLRSKIRTKEDYGKKLRGEREKLPDKQISEAEEAAKHEAKKQIVKSAAKERAKAAAKKSAKELARAGALSAGVALSTTRKAANNSDNEGDTSGDVVLNSLYARKLKQSKKDSDKSKKLENKKKSLSNSDQKKAIKKQYAAKKRAKEAENAAKKTEGIAKKFVTDAKDVLGTVAEFIEENPKLVLMIAAIALLLMVIMCMFSSCSAGASMFGNTMVTTSYTAQDNDILTVENSYTDMEDDLRDEIDSIETDYPGYDEYQYDLAEIGHDPYQLASYLTAILEDYTPSEAQSYIEALFANQYTLTITPVTEIRTRTETRTGYTWVDTGEVDGVPTGYWDSYEYEVEVEYEYYILKVKLVNKGIDAVVRSLGLTADQLNRYEILLETQGNKSYLFEDNIYVNQGDDYLDYDIPGEALTDQQFARMIHEAEKYLGYPYVWGGSSPSTSFDCSGFVSYVINHCGNGWNVGRCTANGLKSKCSIIPASEAKPGDLIFFQGTYNTSGASHVGIYVGNNMMIHCGNPISYAHTDTAYWTQHFYCFGRLP